MVTSVVVASLGAAGLLWVVIALTWRRLVNAIGIEGLTAIGLISSLHFVVSYASRLAGNVIASVTGPFYIFIAGIGNEGLTSTLMAALVVLVPRPGVVTLSSLTVFLLNATFTGQFGVADVLFVSVSIALAEGCLAATGVTSTSSFRMPRQRPTLSMLLTAAGAIGLANGGTLFAQYCLSQALYRLYFPLWYVVAVSLVTGVAYGAVGAAAGTLLGFQLRRTAP